MIDNLRQPTWRLYPVDWMVVGYSLLMVIIIAILGRPLSGYADEMIFYAAMAILALLIVRYVNETRSRWHAFLRLLYPALMITFFYRATGGQIFLLFDHFFDYQVVAWEQSLLGTEPTLFVDKHLLNTWCTEILSFCYFCYYLMFPGLLIALFRRREHRIIREFLAAACLTFFVSYLLFWLYPVEGPRWHLADQYLNEIKGPVFRQLVEFVINNAAVRGGAIPSSHTGVALIVMLFCFRYYRRVGWMLLPVVIGLAAGTVWGRFHYLSDVIVGAAIGAGAVWFIWHHSPLQIERIPVSDSPKIPRTQDVS
ncbi:MAG: phosphatase PAP2 family protein [candidate division Zixibacteria bacterium]|nr:phosphatase PAP2 family protein [candidate division Zixibacteria bacterium]